MLLHLTNQRLNIHLRTNFCSASLPGWKETREGANTPIPTQKSCLMDY